MILYNNTSPNRLRITSIELRMKKINQNSRQDTEITRQMLLKKNSLDWNKEKQITYLVMGKLTKILPQPENQ